MAKRKRKNPAAVSLARRRMLTMTPEQRSEVSRKGGIARRKNLTAARRKEIASLAGKSGGRGRPKNA